MKDKAILFIGVVFLYSNSFLKNYNLFILGNDIDDMVAQETLYNLVFDGLATYSKILNGTPKLSLVPKLSEEYERDKSQLVSLLGRLKVAKVT